MVRVGRIKVGESEGPSAAGWKGERVKGIRVATNGRALMTVTSWLIRSQRELSGLKSVAPLLDVSQHYGVCLVPGSSCACPGYVRVSFANMQVRLVQLLCPCLLDCGPARLRPAAALGPMQCWLTATDACMGLLLSHAEWCCLSLSCRASGWWRQPVG